MNYLEITQINVRRSKNFALSIPDLALPGSKILCIVGPNGSGKTTLINCLSGLLQPDTGTILIAGKPVTNNLLSTKTQLGLVPDDESWFIEELSAQEYFELLTDIYRKAGSAADMSTRIHFLASRLHFTAFDQTLQSLSHGNKKKVQIIAGLMHEPQLIILDEMRNGLDPLAIIAAEQIIREESRRGACIIVATHDLWWAERIADRILLLINGSVAVHEHMAAIIKQYGSLEKLFMSLAEEQS